MSKGTNKSLGMVVEDKILRSVEEEDLSNIPDMGNLSFPDFMFQRIKEQCAAGNDYEFLVNADLALKDEGRTPPGSQSCRISALEPASLEMARGLRQHGLSKGDFVHTYLPNCAEFYFPVFATWLCQGVFSPSDPSLNVANIAHQLQETQGKFVLCSLANLDKILQAVELTSQQGLVRVFILEEELPEKYRQEGTVSTMKALRKSGQNAPVIPACPPLQETKERRETSMVAWSSGTTGRPKGIELTTFSLVKIIFKNLFAEDARLLQTTCFFHGGGFLISLMALVHSFRVFFFPVHALDNQTEKLFRAVDRFKTDMLVMGSHHVVRMSGTANKQVAGLDLTSARVIFPLGTNCPVSLYDDLKEVHFPNLEMVANIYAMSEMGVLCMSMTHENLGKLVPGLRAKVTDPETGEILGPGEMGEIRIRSMNSFSGMKGYLNQPRETAAFFDPDGFNHTGDMGHYDDQGILYFDGRLKDLIKFENCHLYPVQIEEVIQKHPDVIECAVFGRPDPKVQELVTALVVKVAGSALSEKELADWVDRAVDNHQRLRGGVVFVNDIPRNPQGKILRRKLLEMYQRA